MTESMEYIRSLQTKYDECVDLGFRYGDEIESITKRIGCGAELQHDKETRLRLIVEKVKIEGKAQYYDYHINNLTFGINFFEV